MRFLARRGTCPRKCGSASAHPTAQRALSRDSWRCDSGAAGWLQAHDARLLMRLSPFLAGMSTPRCQSARRDLQGAQRTQSKILCVRAVLNSSENVRRMLEHRQAHHATVAIKRKRLPSKTINHPLCLPINIPIQQACVSLS